MSNMLIPIDRPILTSSHFETTLSINVIGRILNGSEYPGKVSLTLRMVSRSLAYSESLLNEMNQYLYLKLCDTDSFAQIQKSVLWRCFKFFSLHVPPFFSNLQAVTPIQLRDALLDSRPGVSIHGLRFIDFARLTLLITQMTDSDLLECFAHVKTLELGRLAIQPCDSEESFEAFRRLLISCPSLTELVLAADSRYTEDLKELLDSITGEDFHGVFGSLKKLRFRPKLSCSIGLDLGRFLRVFDVGGSLESIKTWPFVVTSIGGLSDDELFHIFGNLKEVSNELFRDPPDQEPFGRLLKAIQFLDVLELRQGKFDENDCGPFKVIDTYLTDEDRSRVFGSVRSLDLTDVKDVPQERFKLFFQGFQSLKLVTLTNCQGVLECLRSLGDDMFAQVFKSLEGLTLYKTDIDHECLQRLFAVAPKLVVEVRSKYGETNYLKANS